MAICWVYWGYTFIADFISNPKINAFTSFMSAIAVIGLKPMVNIVALTLRVLKGLPALVITNDGIVDNVNNVSIDWRDVSEIYVTEEGIFANSDLVVNLQTPEIFFCKTPLQKVFYKVRKYFTSADVAIKLSFIKGKEENIVDSINTCWSQSG